MPPYSPGSLEGVRMLVLEDDVDLRADLVDLFRSRGADVLSAEDLRTARALVDDHGPPDLLLADFDLPDGHGASFAQELRSLRPELLAIALTGHGEPEGIDRSSAAGFVAHLVKPLDAETLLAIVTTTVFRN